MTDAPWRVAKEWAEERDKLHDEILRLRSLNERLVGALRKAAETLKVWHGIYIQDGEAEMWGLYQNSPEMRQINAVLAEVEGEKP